VIGGRGLGGRAFGDASLLHANMPVGVIVLLNLGMNRV